jgi:hypothetical protein
MRASFKHGWQDARILVGWGFLAGAALLSLCCIAIAGLLEAQGVIGANSVRRIEFDLLPGATFGLVIPLFAFAASSRLDSRFEVLMRATWARQGDSRRVYALGRLTFPAVLASVVGVVAGVFAVGLSLASSEPLGSVPLGAVPTGSTTALFVLIGTAVLAAATYTGALGLAQLVGGTWARAAFLFVDWLLGSTNGFLALPWPRAHVRALLGGAPVLGLSASQSGEWLLALTLLCALLYVLRLPR